MQMKRLGMLLAGAGLIAASGAIFSAQADNNRWLPTCKAQRRVSMNTPARSIRAMVALTALVLVAGPNAQAFATISDPATGQRVLLGTDVLTPVPGVRIEAESKSKEPLIRVAPQCSYCFGFDPG
jgi:hypothetical protein